MFLIGKKFFSLYNICMIFKSTNELIHCKLLRNLLLSFFDYCAVGNSFFSPNFKFILQWIFLFESISMVAELYLKLVKYILFQKNKNIFQQKEPKYKVNNKSDTVWVIMTYCPTVLNNNNNNIQRGNIISESPF